MKTKYYLIDWPESQLYMDKPGVYQSDGMAFFVPTTLVDREDKI